MKPVIYFACAVPVGVGVMAAGVVFGLLVMAGCIIRGVRAARRG